MTGATPSVLNTEGVYDAAQHLLLVQRGQVAAPGAGRLEGANRLAHVPVIGDRQPGDDEAVGVAIGESGASSAAWTTAKMESRRADPDRNREHRDERQPGWRASIRAA